ncbi:MAG: S8 family serine peptidase [Ilumatobacteraceae bacterium]
MTRTSSSPTRRRAVALGAIGAMVLGATGTQVALATDHALPNGPQPTLGYDPAETNSMWAISRIVGADDLWDAGFVGQGVDVAVIDTGITRVTGLDAPGKVVDAADVSFDTAFEEARYLDAFGHGTHMAGIIAGSDVPAGASGEGCQTCSGDSPYTDFTKFVGIAPEARLVNVKVGAADGSVDVSQVIAGVNWVVEHHADPGMNIRVLNLSFGTDSLQPAEVDPLAYAVDQAWKAGIVVVAAAGNDGSSTTALSNPASTPSVIAVGASNPNGTIDTEDDSIPAFAQKGNKKRTADVVAPGVSVLSLRVPGSFVDEEVDAGKVGERFQRGSGSSQAAAIVSGLSALLVSKYPDATPDQIKRFLVAESHEIHFVDEPPAPSKKELEEAAKDAAAAEAKAAKEAKKLADKLDKLASKDPAEAEAYRAKVLARAEAQAAKEAAKEAKEHDELTKAVFYPHAGSVDVAAAAGGKSLPKAKPDDWTARGTGSLSAARGHAAVVAPDGTVLEGEVDAFGCQWDTSNPDRPVTSCDGDWSGARWSGTEWSGARWSGARWSGARWSGAQWADGNWD